jgi:hypothetical protein
MDAKESLSALPRVGGALIWVGRVLGAGLALLYLAFLFGEGPPDLSTQTAGQNARFLAFAGCVAGGVVGWRWPLAGGALGLVGLSVFYLMNHAASARWPGGAFPLFALPGLFYLMGAALMAQARGPSVIP